MTERIRASLSLAVAALALALLCSVVPAAQQKAFAAETFQIVDAVLLDGSEYSYTGKEVQPKVALVAKGSEGTTKNIVAEDFGGKALKVKYCSSVNVGNDYFVRVGAGEGLKANGSYSCPTADFVLDYRITTQYMGYATVTLPKTSYPYAAEPIRVKPEVTYNGLTLKEGVDYKLSYDHPQRVGTCVMTVTGMGNFTSNVKKSYTITKANLANLSIALSSTTPAYTGKQVKPSVTVMNGTHKLTLNKHYTLTYYKSTNIGTAKVRVKRVEGSGHYVGYKDVEYKIVPGAVSLSRAKLVGDDVSLTWTAGKGATHYNVYRAVNAKTPKWTKLTTTKKLAYTDTTAKRGTTYQYCVKAFKKVDGVWYSSAKSTVRKASVPAREETPDVTALTLTKYGTKGFKAVWPTTAGATGYELRWAPNSSFQGYHFATVKVTSFAKDPDYTQSGQKWYLKVRSYKEEDGVRTYSAWSSTKAITL